MSYSNLKNKRSSIVNLVSAAEKVSKNKYEDDRFWKPALDKVGNGFAVIRFLPAGEKDDLPWIRYWDHGFKGPTGIWYIENSLTSIDKPDPCSEMNSILWNTGSESDKKIARDRKRRLHYVSNIYVISDPSDPSNEGKVFLFKYGKKIFEKITEVMKPEFQDETPVNPFDFWEGCDLKLKIRKVDGYQNYDKSEFSKPSQFLDGDDSKLEKVYNSLYNLSEFLDPKNYKSYDELKEKLNRVLGGSVPLKNIVEQEDFHETVSTQNNRFETDESSFSDNQSMSSNSDNDTDDDKEVTLSYFAKLASLN